MTIQAGGSIALSVNDNAERPALRVESGEQGDAVIAHAPLRVTTVQYSSDERIKTLLEDVDSEDILQRMAAIKMRSYEYTEEWRTVRNEETTRVRGVIAQELKEVFPEHVSVLPVFGVNNTEFRLEGFHQVDKQGLTLDLIAALQAQHAHYNIGANDAVAGTTGDLTVSSSNAVAASGGVMRDDAGYACKPGSVGCTQVVLYFADTVAPGPGWRPR